LIKKDNESFMCAGIHITINKYTEPAIVVTPQPQELKSKELEAQKGKKLPLNIDGAIAVALCSFGWDSKLGKAVFLIARTPGLCGQYLTNS